MREKVRRTVEKVKYIIFFVCLFCVGCLPLTSNGFKDIHVDYSEQDVIKVLGKPSTKNEFYSKKYMIYYVHDSVFSLFFNKNNFPYVGFYPLLRTGTEYWVILDNNKVVAFGPAKRFNGSNIPKALDTKSSYIISGED